MTATFPEHGRGGSPVPPRGTGGKGSLPFRGKGAVPFAGRWARGAVPFFSEALALLALAPLAAAVLDSLTAQGGAAYAQWWLSARGWSALGRTLAVAVPAATLAVGLAWLLVAFAVRLSGRGAIVLALAACLPMLVPSSLVATAWILALGREGVVTVWLRGLGVDPGLNLYSMPGAALVTALRYFGIAALVLLPARLRREGQRPAERVFAIARPAAWWYLHIRPDLRPLAAAWLLAALFAMNDHIIPALLLVSTYGTQVLIQYSALLDPAGATALAAPMAALGLALAAGAALAERRAWTLAAGPPDTSTAGQAGRGTPVRRLLAALGAAAVLGLALVVPLAMLVWRTESPAAIWAALADAGAQVSQTLAVAGAGAAVATILAAVLAARWVAARRGGAALSGRAPAGSGGPPTAVPLVLVNLAVPPSLVGLGTIALFQTGPLAALRDTRVPLVVGCAARFLPVAVLLLYALWRHESPQAALAARVHGVSAWRTAWRVTWPGRRAGVAGAALLTAILIATDLEVSILLAPPGGATLGVRLYTLIHTAPDALVSALALGILLLTAPALCLLGLVAARRRRSYDA